MKRFLNYIVFKTGKFVWLWTKLCKPSGEQYANFLRRHGRFHSIGDYCSIYPYTNITDPEYVKLGDNVRLSNCTLLGHDSSVVMLNRAYGTKLDRVGKIEIGNNVFIGHGAIIMPGIKIDDYVIVAAGAVVSRNVPSNSIVAGVPAKVIGKIDELVVKLSNETEKLPWYPLIVERGNVYDPHMEPLLREMRTKFFFPDE